MMEWRDWPSWRRLNAIARLPVGGAAAAGGLAAGSMAEFVEMIAAYAPGAYPTAVREVAEELLDRQPAIAPLVGLVNTVFLSLEKGPDGLVEDLRDLERRIATSTGLLSEVGASLVEPGSGVLTFGGSGSVKGVLTAVARTKRVFVSCAATMPDGEGVEMAADLAAVGLPVELIPDDEVAEALHDHDMVLMGAAAVGPDAVLNIVGSAALAKEARNVGISFYLVASVEKALPAPLFSRAARAGAREGRYEPIPMRDVTAVVTEFGILDPRAAGSLAAERTVAPELTV
jgi:translation initiation factor 2B subunit (eIF-2B alpha/beta/delta family)